MNFKCKKCNAILSSTFCPYCYKKEQENARKKIKITVELNKKDLWRMIKGSTVSYDLMNNKELLELGYYVGGFVSDWEWYYSFPKKYTVDKLWKVYKKLKDTNNEN